MVITHYFEPLALAQHIRLINLQWQSKPSPLSTAPHAHSSTFYLKLSPRAIKFEPSCGLLPAYLAQTKKHDDLSVYEWTDFSDLTTLATILDGVDVIYVALAATGPSTLPSAQNSLEI
jgi:hypothetical protein